MEYEQFRRKIVGLQSDLSQFKVDFLDRDSFKSFADNLDHETDGFGELCITGYFSEGIRATLETIIRMHRKLRILCQDFDLKSRRDQKNLEVMRRIQKAGAEVKINNRLHARFLVASNQTPQPRGFLVIGSFDFNTDCLSKERYDAGIRTRNPDLVASAVKLFDEIWNEPESILFNEKYPERTLSAMKR